MKFHAYEEGCSDTSGDYDLPIADAAIAFVAEWCPDARGPVNVIIEPADVEARAMVGWHEDVGDDGADPLFRMFVVTPHVRWATREVPTFNPYAKAGAP